MSSHFKMPANYLLSAINVRQSCCFINISEFIN